MKTDKAQQKQKVADDTCSIDPLEEWNLTFDAIPDQLALIDLDMRLMRVNKSFAHQAGKKPEEIVGDVCYHHVCHGASEKDCPHRRTIKDGRSHSLELHLDHLGRDFQITTSPIRDRSGRICGSLHIARDITDSKQAADALRQSETRFRGLVEQSLVGIYILRDGRFLYVNPKLAEIFGYDSAEEIVFGRTTMDLIAPESRPLVAENDRKRLEGSKQSVHYTFKGLRKDGAIIDIEAYGSRTEIEGRPAIIGTLLDITGRVQLERRQRALEERLHHQQRQQSIATLAGGIAHDFNNMLMGVLGGAELLKSRLPAMARERELADTIITTARRMAALTRQLLDFAHQGTYEHLTTDLNQIVRSVLGIAWPKPPAGVETVQSLATDLWPVLADKGQLGQVVGNIIANAIEALETEETGGRIEIRTENIASKPAWECQLSQHAAGDYVHLSVSDNGAGVPPELQQKIFEPFFTTKFMGRGLGLAAALGIVQNHGGCLHVESNGKGATFHIYLPRHVHAGETKAASPARESLGVILVVVDEPDVRSLLTRMLKSLGYEPLVAGNRTEALLAFAERQDEVRLAILDIQLSGPGSAELLRELRSRKPGLKVLVSSGYDECTALAGFGADRPDGFIQKPYWIDMLRDKVTKVLRDGTDD